MLNSADYRKMLKCLHLEGYAQSYEDAEYILETISDEEFDALYETIILNPKIVSHLISEGYAYTSEQAEEMLYHMSDNWKQNILESSARERFADLQRRSAETDATTPDIVNAARQAAARYIKAGENLNAAQQEASSDAAHQEYLTRKHRKKGTHKESVDLYHLLQSYLISEGYADTYEAADQMISFMSEGWMQSIVEATKVVAQQGGVPGTVQVQPVQQGGIGIGPFRIGGTTVNRPVSGTFRAGGVSDTAAARYNTQLDNPNIPASERQRELERSGHSGFIPLSNPSSIPDTGIPGRPSPGRALDQTNARIRGF